MRLLSPPNKKLFSKKHLIIDLDDTLWECALGKDLSDDSCIYLAEVIQPSIKDGRIYFAKTLDGFVTKREANKLPVRLRQPEKMKAILRKSLDAGIQVAIITAGAWVEKHFRQEVLLKQFNLSTEDAAQIHFANRYTFSKDYYELSNPLNVDGLFNYLNQLYQNKSTVFKGIPHNVYKRWTTFDKSKIRCLNDVYTDEILKFFLDVYGTAYATKSDVHNFAQHQKIIRPGSQKIFFDDIRGQLAAIRRAGHTAVDSQKEGAFDTLDSIIDEALGATLGPKQKASGLSRATSWEPGISGRAEAKARYIAKISIILHDDTDEADTDTKSVGLQAISPNQYY